MAKTLLVPLDGKDESSRAVDWDATLGCGITLVHVAHPLDVSDAPDTVITDARTRFPGVEFEAEVIRSRDADREIVDVATRFGASLVVCSTRGRSGVSRAIMGSVAMAVVRRARCPVLVRPARGTAPTAGTDADRHVQQGGHSQ